MNVSIKHNGRVFEKGRVYDIDDETFLREDMMSMTTEQHTNVYVRLREGEMQRAETYSLAEEVAETTAGEVMPDVTESSDVAKRLKKTSSSEPSFMPPAPSME